MSSPAAPPKVNAFRSPGSATTTPIAVIRATKQIAVSTVINQFIIIEIIISKNAKIILFIFYFQMKLVGLMNILVATVNVSPIVGSVTWTTTVEINPMKKVARM